MPVVHRYGLYPWTWDAATQSHVPPDGARAVLDLRSLPQQSTVGQSDGWGFFDWPGDVERPRDAIELGDGDCREISPSASVRMELQLRLGLSSLPSGETLIDCISDVFGDLSDPSGQSGPKPLMPVGGGSLEIRLSGHSKVWGAPYEADEVMAITPNKRANKQRQVWRDVMQTALDVSPEHAEKVLGAILRQHGVTMAEIDTGAPARKSQWQRFLHARDVQRAGGKFRPRRPRTSFSDTFDRADATTLGSGWTAFLSTAEFGISSNKAIGGKAATWGSTAIESARLNSDVSSADHWTEATISNYVSVVSGDNWIGPMSRFSASAHTGYYYAQITRTSAGSNRLDKVVAGVMTSLGTVSASNSDGDVIRCDCSGSSISGKKNGTTQISVTDTSITGHTRGGLVYRSGNFAVRPTYDNFSIDDGIVAGSQPMALRRGSRQGFARVGRQI